MSFKNSLIETMRKRHSVRTFDTKKISDDHSNKIIEYINGKQNLINPFGIEDKIEFVTVTNNVTDKGLKLGTYGIIRNPQGYLIGISKNDKYSIVGFGYTFQKIILFLVELGIGTCWMGGTFNRNSFEKEIRLDEGDFIPSITPIGYPRNNQTFIDRTLRFLAKSDDRFPWEKMFFEGAFDKPLTVSNASRFQAPIEMVRVGPSASNKQPWRLVLTEDQKYCHFYIEHTPNYNKVGGYDMQMLDMGIAMCQFELACKETGIGGTWVIEDPKLALPNEQIEYIVSWKI